MSRHGNRQGARAPGAILILLTALLTFLPSGRFMPAPAAGAETFRLALPGYVFSFPRDHYAHEEYRTEWWYYTGHLRTASGVEYGYQLTFFRSGLAAARKSASRWAARNIYLAHFAVSDIPRGRLRYFERVGRAGLGQAGASDTSFRVWIGDWEVSGDASSPHLQAREGEVAVDLSLRATKPPVIHGENGVSRKGEGRGHASHYYSLTRLATEGTLTLQGKTMAVTGVSWMDHEFGSTQLNADQVGWDWFSLQFDDDTELMLYVIRKADGRPDSYSAGTWIGPRGESVLVRQAEFRVDVLEHWTSPRSRGTYPIKWRIRVPKLGLNLTLTPAFADQELDTAKSTKVIYWEGAVSATGAVQGRAVKAQGYVEMTGYAEPFRKKL
jgi:predicted secreted hydrolase